MLMAAMENDENDDLTMTKIVGQKFKQAM